MVDTSNPFIDALAPLVARVNTTHTWTRNEAGEQRCRKTEGLTRARLAAHLNGGPARGVCPIRKGESLASVAVLDFDDHDKSLPWAAMSLAVGRVVDVLDLAWGLPCALWRSGGGRGVHLYLLWDSPQDAYSVRQWLAGVLASVGLRPGTGGVSAGQVELFPKQAEVGSSEKDWGSQFILPGSRASVPLVVEPLSGLLEERPGGLGAWQATDWPVLGDEDNVPVLERPVRVAPVVPVDFSEGAAWRQALDAIPNGRGGSGSLDYDSWLEILFAVHHESQASEEGRALMHAWSARSPKYVPELVDKYWDGATLRADGITGASIKMHARKLAGWVEPIDASEFTSLVVHESSHSEQSATREPGDTIAVQGEPWELTEDTDTYDRKKDGAIKATVTNALKACRISTVVGKRIAWDEFRDEIMIAEPRSGDWVTMSDDDRTDMRAALEMHRFESAGADLVRDAVSRVATNNRFDSAQLWLRGTVVRWDGVRRVDRFLIDCFGCVDDPYTRAVARYMWTAMAGRVLDPGCQVDMVPLLSGDQGIRKSTAIAALVPDSRFFVEVDLAEDEEKIVRKNKGALVAEIAELSGLQTRQLEWVKKYVTRRHEKWIPKYKELATTYARRVVHFGTTNRVDVLADDTGERRWLPIHVVRADVTRIEAERDQLWAEGALMWMGELDAETPGIDRGEAYDGQGNESRAVWSGGGVAWEDAERLAVLGDVHAAFTASDSWETAISEWLDGDAADDMDDGEAGQRVGKRRLHPLTMAEVMRGALGIAVAAQDMRAQKRAAAVLHRLGFINKPARVGGRLRKMWVLR